VPGLGFKFCIIDLLCFCTLAMVLCGGEQLVRLPVWITALYTAACVVKVVLGDCMNWELLWACVVSDAVSSPPGGCTELLGWSASFSSLRGCSDIDVMLGAIAYSACELCF